LETFPTIVKNLKKLDTHNKSPLRNVDFLGTDTESIDGEMQTICRSVTHILFKYLNHIKFLITTTHEFEKAEANLEHLQRLLNINGVSAYFETTEFKNNLFSLDAILDDTFKVIEEKYARMSLNQFNVETKTFLTQLYTVAAQHHKYKKFYFNLKNTIVNLFEESIKRVSRAKWDDGSVMKSDKCDEIVVEIDAALGSLPDEMKQNGLDAKFRALKVFESKSFFLCRLESNFQFVNIR
jgi:hypothetical protein